MNNQKEEEEYDPVEQLDYYTADYMCAINPTHKKRFIIDVYTSKKLTKLDFEIQAMVALLDAEVKLNSKRPSLRFHLKEGTGEAD